METDDEPDGYAAAARLVNAYTLEAQALGEPWSGWTYEALVAVLMAAAEAPRDPDQLNEDATVAGIRRQVETQPDAFPIAPDDCGLDMLQPLVDHALEYVFEHDITPEVVIAALTM